MTESGNVRKNKAEYIYESICLTQSIGLTHSMLRSVRRAGAAHDLNDA